MIRLWTLNGLTLTGDDGREVVSILAQPRPLALLCYLAVARTAGGQRRDRLLTLFWPEQDAARARHALNQAIYRLRRSLGKETVRSRGAAEVVLDWTRFWCDARAFREALALGNIEEALALYKAPLLEDFHVRGAPEFDTWLDHERHVHVGLAFNAASRQSEDLSESGDLINALRWATKAAEIDPFDEGAFQRRLRLLDALGRRAEALREFEAFRTRLHEALELEPAPLTRAQVAIIRTTHEDDRR